MAELVATLSVSGVVEQNGRKVLITKEAIESIVARVSGDRAVPMGIEHDPFCLPIGKISEARVEPHGSEHAAVARVHVEDGCWMGEHKPSGSTLVGLDFASNTKPFVRVFDEMDGPTQNALSVDLANFASYQDYDAFASDIGFIDDSIKCDNKVVRHSLVPEPFLQFILAEPGLAAALAIGIWPVRRVEKFVRYTVDETLRKVGDDISEVFSEKIRRMLKLYRSHSSDDERPAVTKVLVPGNAELILLTRTEQGEEFADLNIVQLVEEMEKYGDLLQDADIVVFGREGDGDWRFRYMTTHSGKVIGSKECYEWTKTLLSRWDGNGVSAAGPVTMEDDAGEQPGDEDDEDGA